jgi:predicted HAD superfamily phosphohydrolase
MNLICFDLEGPLAPQDNAYELMKLFPPVATRFLRSSAVMINVDSYDLF